MKLMRRADVPEIERQHQFQYSPPRAILAVTFVVCASSALILFGWKNESLLAYYIAGVFLLATLLLRRLVYARFRRSNWLVKMTDDGIFIQFRSYLNHNFSPEDLTVVFIPFRKIRAARLVRQRQELPGDRRDVSQVRFSRLVELELAADSSSLAEALASERVREAPKIARLFGSASTSYRHYPVRLASPGDLQVEWGVVPGAKSFLNGLRQHTDIAAPAKVSRDFTHLKELSREKQEEQLLELAESGQTMAAIKIARELYSYDLTEAKAFVDGLLDKKRS